MGDRKAAAIEATTPEPADVSAAFSATLVGSVNQSMEQSIITITETDLSTSSPNKSSAQDVIVDSNVTPQHIVLRRYTRRSYRASVTHLQSLPDKELEWQMRHSQSW
jgi:hypothetical protein